MNDECPNCGCSEREEGHAEDCEEFDQVLNIYPYVHIERRDLPPDEDWLEDEGEV